MDTGERLAAYLSGDLDTDERTALEADLAGDAALRARLERIRASDDALAGLPDVELPEGFSARLRERVGPEVDAVLGDELAARRARRSTPSWLPALGAAAALAVVVAGGITLSSGMGGDDAASDGAEEGPRTMMGDDGAGEAADTQMQDHAEAEAAAPAGPTVASRGRTLGLDQLRELPDDPDVQAALGADPTQGDPQAAADEFASSLDQASGAMRQTEEEAGGGDAAVTESAPAPNDVADGVSLQGDVSDADLDAIAACLPVLSEEAADPVVPLYVELATDEDGDEVIVYAALSTNADGQYRRVEIWMVDRETCDLRQFVQQDL